MFDKTTNTNINKKTSEPRWIIDGENANEDIANRPIYDVNIKHSYIDYNTFEYRRNENRKHLVHSGFLKEVRVKDLFTYTTDNTLVFRDESSFNYKGAECIISMGTSVTLSKPLKINENVVIDLVQDATDFDMSHTVEEEYLLLATQDNNQYCGKLYEIQKPIQIADIIEDRIVDNSLVLVEDPTLQDLVTLKVKDVNITESTGLVYLHGNKHNTPIEYKTLTDQERVDFFNGKNNVYVKQDDVWQIQYEFIVSTRYATKNNSLSKYSIGNQSNEENIYNFFNYIQTDMDEGIITKDNEDYIPLGVVNRRNAGVYDININPTGSTQSISGEWFHRSGYETPLNIYELYRANITSLVVNIPQGFYADSTLVTRCDKIDDRDFSDDRVYSTNITDTTKYLINRIEANDLRGKGKYKTSNVHSFSISRVNLIGTSHGYSLGHQSNEIIINGTIEDQLNEPGKLINSERAFITDANGVNFEIYAIKDNKLYTIPTADSAEPTFTAGVSYFLLTQPNSTTNTNGSMFVNELLGDKRLLPTGSTIHRECTVEYSTSTGTGIYYITNNSSEYDVVLHSTSYFEYNGNFLSFPITAGALILAGATIQFSSVAPTKRQVHNWYDTQATVESLDIDRRYSKALTVEGNKQFIYLKYKYIDGLRVIRSNDYGMSWEEITVEPVIPRRNGFILETEKGYIYDIMYNGEIPYSSESIDLVNRKLIDYTDVIVTNSDRNGNLLLNTVNKPAEQDSPNTYHTPYKVKKDHNSVNLATHHDSDTNDFDYRSAIVKTLNSTFMNNNKLYANIDYNEFGHYRFDRQIPNPAGENANDMFGYSKVVSNDRTRMAIGAPLGKKDNTPCGLVYLYDWSNETDKWELFETIDNTSAYSNNTNVSHFGTSVALSEDGSVLVVGQGGDFSKDFSRIITFDIDVSRTVTRSSLELNSSSTLLDTVTPMFGNSDDVLVLEADATGDEGWGGIGQSLVLFTEGTNLKLAIGLKGSDNITDGINNYGAVLLCTRHESGQWSENSDGTNLVYRLPFALSTQDIGKSLTVDYTNNILYVGTYDKVIPYDFHLSGFLSLGGLDETTYDKINISPDGEYFVYTTERSTIIKRAVNGPVNGFIDYGTFTRNEDFIPLDYKIVSVDIDDNDILIIGYYNSITKDGIVAYSQPNELNTEYYEYFNDNNLSSEIEFVRNTTKYRLNTQHNQNYLEKLGYINIDLQHFWRDEI